ncbi:hypothetical protein GCM10022262_33910 [Georgenia daeguensis]|uniref:Uncharacterized protein n=1 Tax=Georgenia daeguensis TaxID=908355 RepID=A0ABP8EYI6_9MICO
MQGVRRGKAAGTTVPGKDGKRAGDLLDRDFTAPAPGLGYRLAHLPGSSTSRSFSMSSPSGSSLGTRRRPSTSIW